MTKDLLERTQFELVGPYIVFKRNTDDQIRIKRIFPDNVKNLKQATKPAGA